MNWNRFSRRQFNTQTITCNGEGLETIDPNAVAAQTFPHFLKSTTSCFHPTFWWIKEQSVAWAQNCPLVKWEEPGSTWSTDFCRKYKMGSLRSDELMSQGSGTSSTHPCRCPAELASDGLCGVLSPGQATRGLCAPLRGRAKHALLIWMISLIEPASSWFKVDRVFFTWMLLILAKA